MTAAAWLGGATHHIAQDSGRAGNETLLSGGVLSVLYARHSTTPPGSPSLPARLGSSVIRAVFCMSGGCYGGPGVEWHNWKQIYTDINH